MTSNNTNTNTTDNNPDTVYYHMSATPTTVSKTTYVPVAKSVGGDAFNAPFEVEEKGVVKYFLRHRILGVPAGISASWTRDGKTLVFLTISVPNWDAKTTKAVKGDEVRSSSSLRRIQVVVEEAHAQAVRKCPMVYVEGSLAESLKETTSWKDAAGETHDPKNAFSGGLYLYHVQALGGISMTGAYQAVIGSKRKFGSNGDATTMIDEPFMVVGLPANARVEKVSDNVNSEGEIAYSAYVIKWMATRISAYGFEEGEKLPAYARVSARVSHYERPDGSKAATVKLTVTK